MRSSRVAAAIAVAVVLVSAGCSDDSAGSGGVAEPPDPPTLELKPTGEDVAETGFDECGLVEPAEIAEVLGVDAMYVTARSAVELDAEGDRRAGCKYLPAELPGISAMEIATVTGTDPERFFAPFADNFQNVETIADLGDRAEAVAYGGEGTHYIEIRTILGDRGLHFHYAYADEGGLMPEADGRAAALILTKALEQLPDEVVIPDGTPEGKCADVDLEAAAEVVGGELTMARSVLSDDGAMSCAFTGGNVTLDIAVTTDPDRVAKDAVEPDTITHADIGDGARLMITEAGGLLARANVGDHVVIVQGGYAEAGSVTELRPEDVELVRSIVDVVGEGN